MSALLHVEEAKQLEAAKDSEAKTKAAMVELGKMISGSAAAAPALLRSAKNSLDDKQLELDDLRATHAALKIEADTYKVGQRNASNGISWLASVRF